MLHALVTPPYQRPPDAQPFELLPGKTTWQCPLGYVQVTLDTAQFDFHMDVAPDCPPTMPGLVLAQLHRLGFEAMDEDECESELLRNGSIRVYLCPIIPVDDAPLIPATEAA